MLPTCFLTFTVFTPEGAVFFTDEETLGFERFSDFCKPSLLRARS